MTRAELSGCISIFKARPPARPHSEKAVTLVFSRVFFIPRAKLSAHVRIVLFRKWPGTKVYPT